MAIGAGSWRYGVQARQREPRGVVIKRGVQPCAGAVALLAGLRKIRCDVIGIGRALEVLQVASHASRARQVVVTVDMAIGAGTRWHGMQAGEREAGAVVIKSGIQPGAGGMALLASLREIRGDVIGISCALEVL